jgi:hypothetical protein
MNHRIPVHVRRISEPPDGWNGNPYTARRYMNPATIEHQEEYVSGAYLNLAIDSFIESVTSQGKSAASKKISSLADEILEVAQYYCPVDKGDLVESGTVVKSNSGHGGTVEAQVRFRTRYALFVHEDTTAYHEPPTQAKYLEQAMLDVLAMEKDTPMKSRFRMEMSAPLGFRGHSRRQLPREYNEQEQVLQQIGKKPK